jgi:FAD/FMN-containing dehydrogenase
LTDCPPTFAGNLHFNVTSARYNPDVVKCIEPFLYEFVSSCGGSISAEHGLGLAKNKHIGYSRKAAAVDLMRQLKTVLDPQGILNPYKTLPPAKQTDCRR